MDSKQELFKEWEPLLAQKITAFNSGSKTMVKNVNPSADWIGLQITDCIDFRPNTSCFYQPCIVSSMWKITETQNSFGLKKQVPYMYTFHFGTKSGVIHSINIQIKCIDKISNQLFAPFGKYSLRKPTKNHGDTDKDASSQRSLSVGDNVAINTHFNGCNASWVNGKIKSIDKDTGQVFINYKSILTEQVLQKDKNNDIIYPSSADFPCNMIYYRCSDYEKHRQVTVVLILILCLIMWYQLIKIVLPMHLYQVKVNILAKYE